MMFNKIFIVAVFFVLIASGCSITGETVEDCKEVKVPYETTEKVVETERYTETIPVEKEVSLEYTDELLANLTGNCGSLTNYIKCYYIDIANLDYTGGSFTVDCNFRTLYRTFSEKESAYIGPKGVVRFKCEADVNFGEDVELTYNVVPPTKKTTVYENVPREKETVSYKPVVRYRIETVCD